MTQIAHGEDEAGQYDANEVDFEQFRIESHEKTPVMTVKDSLALEWEVLKFKFYCFFTKI